jgi:hypothetical protein
MTTRTNKGLRLISVMAMWAFIAAMTGGCFNTYRVSADEYRKLQTSAEVPRTIKSKSGTDVLVEETTNTYVRSVGGRRYPITPFNFKMTASQLVASDRDTLLSLGEIAEFEVDHLSTPLTVGIISAAVVLAGGLITYTILEAE